MPPEGAGKPLTPEQVGLLRGWDRTRGPTGPTTRDRAAETSDHWSFRRPVRPEPPEADDPSWIRNPIDRFVSARLAGEGLKPSPEADRTTLIRRLSLDLIGLPPTIAEVDAFVLDDRPDAYERLVDRLLASPHYGERWARRWLDGARYADTQRVRKGTASARSGPTATGSSRPSTMTCRSTSSRSSRSPGTSCRARPRLRKSPPAFTATR